MTTALPISIPPRPGESIESWLEHLADANGLTTAQLLAATGRGRAGTRYLTLAPSPEAITRLAALARVDEDLVYAATLASFDGTALDLTGLDPTDRHSYRQVAARGWTPAHGTQICPACLADTGTWKTAWRLLLVTACTHHGLVLVPNARRVGGRSATNATPTSAASALPPSAGTRSGKDRSSSANRDLTTLPTTASHPAVLATQARIDAALAGEPVVVLGQPAEPAAYLADLRHLTTLLLHLAGQPGAEPSPLGLRPRRRRRRPHRGSGPRWGMRPPDDPNLRGEALATADAILAAATSTQPPGS
jgi:hypothetical protein